MPRLTAKDYAVKKPCQQDLDLYVRCVLEGKMEDEIVEALRYDIPNYRKCQPFFLSYFREAVKDKYLKEKESAAELFPITTPLKEKFIDCLRSGLTIARAAQIIGVPLPIITDVWYSDEEFKILATYAVETAVIEAEKALYRRAVGFEHDSETSTTTKTEGYDKEGGPVNTSTTTVNRSRKIVYPDVAAVKYFLWNRNPDRWKKEGDSGDMARSEKGKILEFIDKEIADDPQP
jgi:hypothetical protein